MLGAGKIKVKRSLFPRSWSIGGGDPDTDLFMQLGKPSDGRDTGVMSKFTQPMFFTPVEWNKNYTTYPRGLL